MTTVEDQSRSPFGAIANMTIAMLIYLSAVVAMTGLLSVPLYLGLDAVGLKPAFHKVVIRVLELCALGGLAMWLMCQRRCNWAAWGYRGSVGQFAKRFGWGLSLGLISMGCLVSWLYAVELRQLEQMLPSATEWVRIGIAVLLGALATAVIEETLFRGGLQSTLSKGGQVWLAAMIGSAVFAAAHFLDAEAYAGPIEWWSGLDVLWRSLQGFRDAPWHDSFIALLLAGLLLCFLRLRSGDIAAAIGVHMGWVVVIRLCKSLTELDRASPWVVWVGAYDGVVGYAGALLFLSLLAIGWVVYKPSPQLSGS